MVTKSWVGSFGGTCFSVGNCLKAPGGGGCDFGKQRDKLQIDL